MILMKVLAFSVIFPGIPERADLAETYYSQFDEEFEAANGGASDEDDENEKTLVGGGEMEDAEVEDLISCMQNALDKSDTSELYMDYFVSLLRAVCWNQGSAK